MRIAFAVDNPKGLDSTIAGRFGRAEYFVIVDLDENRGVVKVEEFRNPGAESGSGAGVKSAQFLVDKKVDAAVGPSFGPNASAILTELGIKTISMAPGTSLKEALERIKDILT